MGLWRCLRDFCHTLEVPKRERQQRLSRRSPGKVCSVGASPSTEAVACPAESVGRFIVLLPFPTQQARQELLSPSAPLPPAAGNNLDKAQARVVLCPMALSLYGETR